MNPLSQILSELQGFWESQFCKISFVEHTKRGLNPKDEPSISKVTAIFVGQGMTKSNFLKISQMSISR